MRTVSGLEIDLRNFIPPMVSLWDIANALSKTHRFNGHTTKEFSVLEHSLVGSLMSDTPKHAMEALLHDAGEAYTGDIILPMKEVFPELCEFEDELTAVIFDTLWPGNELVKEGKYCKSPYMIQLDRRMAAWESYYLRPNLPFTDKTRSTWEEWMEVYLKVRGWMYEDDPKTAFIKRYNDLKEELGI